MKEGCIKVGAENNHEYITTLRIYSSLSSFTQLVHLNRTLAASNKNLSIMIKASSVDRRVSDDFVVRSERA